MGAIFGYVGTEPCQNALNRGIEMQSHRGNDINGIALKGAEGFLSYNQIDKPLAGGEECRLGIAECSFEKRKNTKNSLVPAANSIYCVAMDGCIDNFDELKRWTGEPFEIATDEELFLAMLCVTDLNDKLEMLNRLQKMIKGAPSVAFVNFREDSIYALCGVAPLFIGYGESGCYISSEVNALAPFCDKYIQLELGESAKITKSKAIVLDTKMHKVKKSFYPCPEHIFYNTSFSLGDEAYYCPLIVKEINQQFLPKSNLKISGLKLHKRGLERIKRIVLTADCDSLSAAIAGAYNIEMLCNIPCIAIPAGEMRYSGCVLDKSTLVIAISHRGEDQNTLACAKRSLGYGAKAIAITSNQSSALARCDALCLCPSCDYNYTSISLRGFISQYLTLCYLGLEMGTRLGIVDSLQLSITIKMAELLPGKTSSAIKQIPNLTCLANQIAQSDTLYFIGLGVDFAVAAECCRKTKQIVGINAQALSPSQLVDNGLSLEGATVVAIITNKEMLPFAMRDIRRCGAMGADITILTTESIEDEIKDLDRIIAFNDSLPLFNPVAITAGFFRAAIIAKEICDKNSEKRAV